MRRGRLPRSSMIAGMSELDKSRRFMKKKLGSYVDRILQRESKFYREILEMLYWLIGPEILKDGLDQIAALVTAPQRRRFESQLRQVFDPSSFSNTVIALVKEGGRNLEDRLVREISKILNDCLEAISCRGESQVEKSLSLFKEMFRLSDLEAELCLFLSIIQIWDEPRSLFEYHLHCEQFAGRSYLAIALDATDTEIATALNGKLAKIGILEVMHDTTVTLEGSFMRLLHDAANADIKTEFFKKVDPNPVPLDAHRVDPVVTRHLLNLLGARTESSTHVLLYGSPGTGKTSYALGLAKELGFPIYFVEHAGKDRKSSRQLAFTACVNMASQGDPSIIIADDCDATLGTRNSWSLLGETSDKRWLHDLLETPKVRMIWTVNSTSNIEESVGRRFSFSLGFRPFSTGQRVHVWKSILDTHGVGWILDMQQIKYLATKFQSTPGVIEQAVRKVAESGCRSPSSFFTALNLSLEAHDTLVHGGIKLNQTIAADTDFILEAVNTPGTDLNALMMELKAYSQHIKETSGDDGSTMAILFHGPSGTGKTYMARHIAALLDREIVFKRGSDLLSKWVGGTEANIRRTYEEANDDAVLVFDEADSLIFGRDRAERSWEISQTNEFLTWIEQFRGIQIFTTNRLKDLDSASLRRFIHKIEFCYLTQEGNAIFYKKLLAPLVTSRMNNEIEKELKSICKLAPGDFKVVRDKFRFKEPRTVTHQSLLLALREEARVKSVHAGERAIGF